MSDNQVLSFLLKCKLSNVRMSRWIKAIQEYDFSIKYCKASENKMADTVSRYPLVEQENYSATKNKIEILASKYVLPDDLKTQLKKISIEQREEKKNSQQIKDKEYPEYQIVNNTLYKLINGQWKIMVPDNIVEDLTWACHESLAHACSYKCYLTLREDFIWMNISRKIKSILRTRHTCQTSKYPTQHTYVEMGNIVTRDKNELLCTDLLGPLPRAARGMRNLVVYTDAFSKHVSLYAIGRPTTEAILKVILEKYVPKYGHVRKILSDRGRQFQNKE